MRQAILLFSSKDNYLHIYEEHGATRVNHKPYSLYENGAIVGMYKTIKSAKSAAHKFYGSGIPWVKEKSL